MPLVLEPGALDPVRRERQHPVPRVEGVSLTVWQDEAESLSNRLSLMLRSGFAGFAFVFLVLARPHGRVESLRFHGVLHWRVLRRRLLALFLELRLAFWVSLGIPISFLGAIALMPGLDVSFNMLSLFAFVLVLGIVVDDAIIVGENIYRHQEEHGNGLRGAIEGAREIDRLGRRRRNDRDRRFVPASRPTSYRPR